MGFDKIVSIHGVPRSGTSWLGQIFNSSEKCVYKYQPLFSYEFKDRINLKSTKKEILDYYNELFNYESEFLDYGPSKKSKDVPRHFKKYNSNNLVTKMVRYHYLIPHLAETIENIGFVFIIRHPCGVINSWLARDFNDTWNKKEEWYFAQSKNKFRPEEYFGFAKWKEATKLFLEMNKKYPSITQIIKYEELVSNPYTVICDVFMKLGIDMTEQVEKFIQESTHFHVDGPHSVFKNEIDTHEWKTNLSSNIIDRIFKEVKKTELEQFIRE